MSAGLQGIRDGSEPATDAGAGVPESLEAAVSALDEDQTAKSWLPPELLETYMAIKTTEIAHLSTRSAIEACGVYLDIY
jgi:glutamine synthetase